MIAVDDIPKIVPGSFLQKDYLGSIEHLVTDTRNIQNTQNAAFFAIRGAQQDGHEYLENAYKAGIRCFFVDKSVPLDALAEATIFQSHASTISTLQKLAAAHRQQFSIPVVGITGSNGKTIIKEWLSSLLGEKFVVVKSPKSYNSQVGVPLSVWNIQPYHTMGVFEAGISTNGEMEALQNVIQPTIGIFTNIGSAHAAGFSSMEEKLNEKLKLFSSCDTIVYCIDHTLVSKAIHKTYPNKNLVGWSFQDQQAAFFVKKENSCLEIYTPDRGTLGVFPCPFSDAPSLENLSHCLVTALLLGVPTNAISEITKKLTAVKMRLELKEGLNQTYIIDDSYNNDIKGLEVALNFFSQQRQYPKKTVILSDMEQSGLEPKELYKEINRLLKIHNVDQLIGIGQEIADPKLFYDLPTKFYASTDDFLQHIPHFQEEIILIKGARHFHLEKIATALQRKVHGTHLEINLEALTHNLQFFRSKLKKSTKVMVMIKALGYGSGSKEIAQTLQYHQADYLGVAYVDEAIELRKSGIHLPILVMNPTVESLPMFEKYQLSPDIYSHFMLDAFQEVFKLSDTSPPIHIKIDTGMHRLGFRSDEIPALLAKISSGNIKIAGIFTHLAAADDPNFDAFTLAQLTEFQEISDQIISSIGYKPLLHALNTPGILRFPTYQFDMVRLGIGLYGYGDFDLKESGLRPVSTLKTSISQIRKVKSGESVGYGRSWVAERNSQIATIAIGYADGYRRAFGQGVGKVNIGGRFVPTVGNICMDMCMVDVTGLRCGVGDEVIVFGDSPTIVELAAWADTIPYEIMTNVSDRVRRVYTTE